MKHFIALWAVLTVVVAVEFNDSQLNEFKTGNKLFTSDVYTELTKSFQENFLVSPFSVETVLALTQSGAKDETAEEIRTSLRLPNSKEKTETVLAALIPQLTSDHYTLQSANKIYIKDNFPILDDFKKTATEIYHAGLENIDFTKKDKAAKTINTWVESQTQNKIKDLITSNKLNEDSRLILINALYFQGNWSIPFKLVSTVPKDFYKSEKDVVQVDTMHATGGYNYYECTEVDAKFLELTFKGGDASLVVILPNDKEGIANLESKIDKVFTPRPFVRELVEVALPKFKIETTIDFEEVLKNLGVKKVFNGTEADLSGISGKKGELIVSSVVQKSFIDVNEEGVEAAAATFVDVANSAQSSHFPVKPPKTFIADHPFIFYIKVKDVVLFGGRVSLPTQQK